MRRRSLRVLWYEEDLANRLAVLERRLRLGRLRQRILAVDMDFQPTTPHPIKNLAGAFLELEARRRIGAEIHPGEIEAALGAEQARIDWRDRTTGLPVDHHHAARAQAVQALGEGRLADTVVDHVDATAIGEPLHVRSEIALGVEDHIVGSGLPRRLGLRLS